MTSVYTIENNGRTWQTSDTDSVEYYLNQGATIKARHTSQIVKQTDDDVGTLHMKDGLGESHELAAEPGSWLNLGEMV